MGWLLAGAFAALVLWFALRHVRVSWDRPGEDAATPALASAVMVNRFPSKVVGVTRQNSDGSNRQATIRSLSPGDALQIRREPRNQHDPNAVAVLAPDGRQVGYLSKGVARRMAQGLDAGELDVSIEVLNITGGTNDKPTLGLNVEIEERYR